MTELVQEAMATVASLPDADQERIGRDVLSHVEKLHRLRTELDKGIASLDRGEGKPLDMEEFVQRAHRRHRRA